MTGDNGIWFVAGAGLGFFMSVFILDKYYSDLMKRVIDEIHKGYNQAIETLKLKYEKNNNDNN